MATAAHAVAAPHPPARPALTTRLISLWEALRARAAAYAAHDGEPLLLTERIAGEHEIPQLDRLTIAQWLWGAGFHIPGGEAHVLELVKPLALNPAMSMLDAAAGLGGPARAIAHCFGTYVTGLERDEELAKRGMEMSILQGMQKRAPVSACDPENLQLRAGTYDRILGRQVASIVANRERFLLALVTALKARGHLLLTDFVLEPKVGTKPEISIWAGLPPRRPDLWTLGQYTDCLTKLGLEIRVTEDTTRKYHGLILTGWTRLLDTVDLRHMPRKHVPSLLDEAEAWVRTIRALESGALRVFRFHAISLRRATRR